MKKIRSNFRPWAVIVIPLLLSFALYQKKHIKVFMIGDSTMCVYNMQQSPVTGWGMPFSNFFDSTVTVKDEAQSGRSTRTFIEENFWQPIADNLSAGDYLFIQFGHNDEVPTKKAYTPEKDFKAYLARYITEARARGAYPILLTPVARRHFDDAGKIQETHAVYSVLVSDVAREYKVPFIDLDKKSQELLQELGVERSQLLFNHLKAGENPHYPDGLADNTHFNELGARIIAEIVLKEIKSLKLELADRIVKPQE